MLISLITSPERVESLLDSLDEAEFSLKNVSVIMKDQTLRDKIADDQGPLKGLTIASLEKTLTKFKVASLDIERITKGVMDGKAAVAITTDAKTEKFIEETLKDHTSEISICI